MEKAETDTPLLMKNYVPKGRVPCHGFDTEPIEEEILDALGVSLFDIRIGRRLIYEHALIWASGESIQC
jgi:hypothetical protein